MAVAAFIFLASTAVGLIALWLFLLAQNWLDERARSSVGWPTTPGRIVTSHMVAFESFDGGPGSAPNIYYLYRVDGKEFGSDRVRADSTNMGDDDMQKYPVGAEVEVYHRPEDPADALLELNPATNEYKQAGFMVAAMFSLGGLIFAAMWLLA